MKSVNILAVGNGVGISRDVDIIKRLLIADGYEVEANHCFKFKPYRRYDLQIHLERFNPHIFPIADVNVMIPNQEWFEKPWLGFLKNFDAFFTKTAFATKIFNDLGVKTEFIGFTSEDRYIPTVKKDPYHWVHVAGKSIQKQTEMVIRTWEKNPGFPQLTIIQDPRFWKPRTLSKNINYMIDRVSEDVLKIIQNTSVIHVCPSVTEGFGHYIMEAMSAKSIVLTTDGPPMNELVTKERGILIPSSRNEPMNLSTKFYVDEHSLAEAVIKTTIMDDGLKNDMANAAREFFLRNDAEFQVKLLNAIRSIIS